ncbi:hypothetical protein GCM10010252_07640 [Streptomyces aureoverticillatus]|nr:hypothetical protein GCM10010252_07640 [Streptomyces aureoverticillatus]
MAGSKELQRRKGWTLVIVMSTSRSARGRHLCPPCASHGKPEVRRAPPAVRRAIGGVLLGDAPTPPRRAADGAVVRRPRKRLPSRDPRRGPAAGGMRPEWPGGSGPCAG